MTHPNAELVRRLFGAFGNDAKQISATFDRDVLWRVPGDTVMSGEYRGRRDVVDFLRRTSIESGGTYGSPGSAYLNWLLDTTYGRSSA